MPRLSKTANIHLTWIVCIVIGLVCAKMVSMLMEPSGEAGWEVKSDLRKLANSDDGLALMREYNSRPRARGTKFSQVKFSDGRVMWRAEYSFTPPKQLFREQFRHDVVCEVEDGSRGLRCYTSRVMVE